MVIVPASTTNTRRVDHALGVCIDQMEPDQSGEYFTLYRLHYIRTHRSSVQVRATSW